jgi:hypothetical protein
MTMLQMGIRANTQTAFVGGRRTSRKHYMKDWGDPDQNRKATQELDQVTAEPTVPQHFSMNKAIEGNKVDPSENKRKFANVVYSARAQAAGQGPLSTNIKSMSYVPGRGLNVTFKSGSVYNYPQQYAAALENIKYSYSPGRTFIAAIKNTGTPYTKINDGEK